MDKVMNKVLVVIDMQNDFIDGSLGTKEAQAIIPKVVEKIKNFNGIVYATLDFHDENYLETQEGKYLPVKHCIDDTDGFELKKDVDEAIFASDPEYDPLIGYYIKSTFGSADLAFDLYEENKEFKFREIELIGVCTDICVISNALMLKSFLPNVLITVDASCCAGVTPESHKRALEAMKMCQINVIND